MQDNIQIFDPSVMVSSFPYILSKLPMTLELTAVSVIAGLLIGFLLALVKINKTPILAQVCAFFVSFMRGTPQLVQLFLVYYGLPLVMKEVNMAWGTDIKELNDCINSGVVGSKAVLELLKYPAYADRVSTAVRERAFEGSKSPAQKAFENGNAAQLRENEQALASVYMQGFHLRNIAKQVTAFKKPSAWNPENEAV